MKKSVAIAGVLFVVATGVGAAYLVHRSHANQATRYHGIAAVPPGKSVAPPLPPASPASDVQQPHQGLAPNENSQVASVAEAVKTKSHPERLSPFVAAKPFDQKSFEADPKAYLDIVEPSRVFQTAQATGPESVHLSARSESRPLMRVGDSMPLTVKGVPKSPVTFLACDGGHFSEDKLNCITVQADEQGIAQVHYVADPGTIADVGVLAASPVAVGQQRFIVHVVSAQ